MVDDPRGLLDRNMQDADVAYDTFVTEAAELEDVTRQWYEQYRTDTGEPGSPAKSDLHHGYWRGISREVYTLGFRTLRQAYQDAWPLSDGGGVGPHPPSVASALRQERHYFIKQSGERFTAIGATNFNLQKIMCDDGDPTAVIAQHRACGFNMARVFLVGDWGDPQYLCRPQDHPDYYQQLAILAQVLADHGMYFQATAFCDTPRIFPTDQARLDHWHRTIDALQPFENVLLELVNENDVPVNTLDPGLFVRPSGILSAHGSNGSQQLAVRPPWDWESWHSNGASEEQRKVGHNAQELFTGTEHWPPGHVPVITNETSRYPEVGMWAGAPIARQQMLAFDSAAGAALLCAGSCFHSVNGKLSLLWTPEEETVARAWADGARSVPLEYQDGQYTASHLAGIELEPNELRRYGRRLPDGRTHWVSIRK